MLGHDEKATAKDAVVQSIKLKGHALDLLVMPDALFVPNAVSRLFSKIVEIAPGDVVFDVGTGTGVLAIWAALEPSSRVYAVDPVAEHCELAEQNARRHGVADKIDIFHGSLFDPLPTGLRANVIIGDVSGIADGPGKALGWYSNEVPTGGGDGTDVIIELLGRAHDYLVPGGKLYFPVAVGLSADEKIMCTARKCFAGLVRKVDVWFPLSDEEYDIVSCCLPPALLERVARKGSRMAWNGHIYEATRPTQG
ncbi:MAG TPA: class I SAM-dependent methyltransferase [Thermoguttaceae bacterium]|nr:class I SAM-dependent methyltransferase [Thermoguttaceae bacterium]